MRLKYFFGLFLITFCLLELVFISASMTVLIKLNHSSRVEVTHSDYKRIFSRYKSEIIGDIMLGHSELLSSHLDEISTHEQVGISLQTPKANYFFNWLPQSHDIEGTYSLDESNPRLGYITFQRHRAPLEKNQLIIFGFFVIIQTGFFGLMTYFFYNWARNSLIAPFEMLVASAKSNLVSNNELYSTKLVPSEIYDLSKLFNKLWTDLEKQTREATIGRVSAQVAHDIQSPLCALDLILPDLSKLPAEKLSIARIAISRIKEIAQDLIQKGQNQKADYLQDARPELICNLVERITSEKTIQHSNSNEAKLTLNISQESKPIFCLVNSSHFQRALSNIITNAFEATSSENEIKISCTNTQNKVTISIADNGIGIAPQILPSLTTRGFTHAKQGGSGLGLFHARSSIESWGGRLLIQSELGRGTTVSITLPISQPPNWWAAELSIPAHKQIVVTDDDKSMHAFWTQRLQREILTFSNPDELRHYVKGQESIKDTCDSHVFLTDFEFLNHSENGLDLISELDIVKSSVLVTGRYMEHSLQDKCHQLHIKIVPKDLVSSISLS